jgi:hypothetical protein
MASRSDPLALPRKASISCADQIAERGVSLAFLTPLATFVVQ